MAVFIFTCAHCVRSGVKYSLRFDVPHMDLTLHGSYLTWILPYMDLCICTSPEHLSHILPSDIVLSGNFSDTPENLTILVKQNNTHVWPIHLIMYTILNQIT